VAAAAQEALVEPTRSASTVAGIDGNRASSTRTAASTPSNADPAGARQYRGGDSNCNARATVARANPSRAATARADKPPKSEDDGSPPSPAL
jgi:hypothetical protein